MNNLHDALEACLQDLELGADLESSLRRYPDIADELGPVLEISIYAKELAVSGPSEEVMRRNRAKLLQRAAEMREIKLNAFSNVSWFNSFRRAAVILALLAIIFLSGTSLVRASSTTLPGDPLYPVKRSWEDLSLLLTLDSQQRDSLAVQYENERLEELHELIAMGRSAQLDFAGIVEQQNGNQWVVADVTVMISSQTELPDGVVFVGDAVRVFGSTQSNTSVLAARIDRLPEGATLPDAGNSGKGSEAELNSGSGSGNSGSGNVNDSSGPGNGNEGSNENHSGPRDGSENGNDDHSGTEAGNDNSGSGGNDNTNNDNSGSGSGNDNENNSGSGSGQDQSNDNGSDDHSGPGGRTDNSNEDNSGSGGEDD